jgi:hypothetical protein
MCLENNINMSAKFVIQEEGTGSGLGLYLITVAGVSSAACFGITDVEHLESATRKLERQTYIDTELGELIKSFRLLVSC